MNKALVNEDEQRLTLLKEEEGYNSGSQTCLDFICLSDISCIIMFLFCIISCLHDVCIIYLYNDATASAGPKLL